MVIRIPPAYSKKKVDWAGQYWTDLPQSQEFVRSEYLEASNILTNWRTTHAMPLTYFGDWLRKEAPKADPDALVAQRLKRLPSITSKILREKHMKLSTMQDIAGARVILKDLEAVGALDKIMSKSRRRHELSRRYDYLESPASSGYRGIHRVYKFRSEKYHEFDGLRVEVQLRTELQHAWATAVESVGMYFGEDFKRNEGDPMWLDFFRAAGDYFSYVEPGVNEAVPIVVLDRLKQTEHSIGARKRLSLLHTITRVAPHQAKGKSGWLLIEINKKGGLHYEIYATNDFEKANTRLTHLEQVVAEDQSKDVLLVSLADIRDFTRAYPNYASDVFLFLKVITHGVPEA